MTKRLIPQNAADLYTRSGEWAHRYGSDFFFVTGTLEAAETSSADKNFSFLSDQTFSLSDKVALNPIVEAQGLSEKQKAARASFLQARAQDPALQDRFPTLKDVRERQGTNATVSLLSGGYEIFVQSGKAERAQTKWALFRRTHPATPGFLTGPNGLASGPRTAEVETMEELTFVSHQSGQQTTVYGLSFAPDLYARQASVMIKKGQEPVLRSNLAEQNRKDALSFDTLVVEGFSPAEVGLEENCLIVRDPATGQVIDTLTGSLGFEKNYNTVTYRRLGRVYAPEDTQLQLVDGEPFARPGVLCGPAEVEEACRTGKALSSLIGVAERICARWPEDRPVRNGRRRHVVSPITPHR